MIFERMGSPTPVEGESIIHGTQNMSGKTWIGLQTGGLAMVEFLSICSLECI